MTSTYRSEYTTREITIQEKKSSVHKTAVEPMNLAERLFGKFMNGNALVNKTTTVSNRELCPKSPFFMNCKMLRFCGDIVSPFFTTNVDSYEL